MIKYCVVAMCAFLFGVGVVGSSLINAQTTAPTSQPAVADAKPVNTKCPVSGEDIDPNNTTIYKGKTYAFCCADCMKAFKKDPEKYASKAK